MSKKKRKKALYIRVRKIHYKPTSIYFRVTVEPAKTDVFLGALLRKIDRVHLQRVLVADRILASLKKRIEKR